ncbi:MAG: extracellular solute-binding protein [Subdoligranulum sp.]|nr:extracellular solute-binding protein [Subdoligranulum sp.]
MKHLNLKRALALLMACMMLFSVGCSSSSSDTTPPAAAPADNSVSVPAAEPEAPKEESIRVITYFAGSDTWAPTWKEVIAEYMEEHPNITIIDESMPTSGTTDVIRPKMNADITANTPADCALYFNGTDAEPLYKSGLYVTWDEILNDDPEWRDQFLPAALEAGKTNGEISNLPYIGSFEGLIYNQAIFDEYDLEYPTSWENIIKACEVISADGKYIPLTNSLLRVTALFDCILLAQVGPEKRNTYLDPSWAQGVDRIKELYDAGAFPKDAATLALADVRAMFAEGKGAMMFDGSWVLASVEDNPDMRMIPCPILEGGTGEEGAVIADYASGWYLSKAAYERSSATLDFVKFMCSPETLARFIEVGGYSAMQLETSENTKPVNVSAAEMMAAATRMVSPVNQSMNREVYNSLSENIILVCETGKTSEELIDESRKMLEEIEALEE